MDYLGKRMLILGGAYLHNKVVEAAKEMGIYTIVTDNVEDSPAKRIADKSYNINVSDVDDVVAMCRKEKVDAVLTVCLDFCQIYYQQICERLGLPCYGTFEQFKVFTDKEIFKKACIENGVDVIPTYTESQLYQDNIYPLLIKPAHNRGSRGQAVCQNVVEAKSALIRAKSLSDNGHAIIEKHMGDKEDFQVTYLVIDGTPYVVRTADRYLGAKEANMDRVAIALSSPSSNTELYMQKAHNKVCKLLKSVGIKNGPIFMQGFVDEGTFRFYDPGLRFPGGDYDRIFSSVMGVNLMKLLIELAFTGEIKNNEKISDETAYLNGNTIFTLHSTINAGVIAKITSVEKLREISGVKYVSFRHKVGDEIELTGTVNQRIAEFNIYGTSSEEIKKTINEINSTFEVLDTKGESMLFCRFDAENWRECQRSVNKCR